jgi:hypothetical protein
MRYNHQTRALALALGILAAATFLIANGSRSSLGDSGDQAVLITATPLPTVNPTPFGGPIAVGPPLPTPALSPDPIAPSNVGRLLQIMELGKPSDGVPSDVLFTRDGQRLLADWDRLTVWRMPGGQIAQVLPVSSNTWTPLAISPDGENVVIGNYENLGWVELWNISGQKRVRQHQGGQQVRALGFNAAGTLLAAGRSDSSVTVWNVETGDLLHELQKHGGSVCMGMAFHPERDEIAASSAGNTVRIWDAWEGQVQAELTLPDPPTGCALSSLAYRPDGGMLAGAMFWERSIVLWQGDSYLATLTHPGGGTVWSIGWSPDGTLLAAIENAGPQGQQMVLWDVHNLTIAAILEEMRAIATFSPDGSRLVTYRFDTDTWLGSLHVLAKATDLVYLPAIFHSAP